MLANAAKTALGLAGAGVFPLTGCAHDKGPGGGPRQGLVASKEIAGSGSLKVHASAKGMLTGFAVIPELLRADPVYAALVREHASVIVAENAMKWSALRPTADTYYFEQADALLNFAEQNQMKVRGHNLLWHRQLPGWFAGTAHAGNARRLLEAHIETVAGRYAGRMHSWDVVNEAIEVKDGRPDGLRDSPWLRLAGEDYVEVAFTAARKADPQALLTYNDYGIESESPQDEAKRQAVLLMLRRMRARRIPIDAVGIQSHIAAGPGARYGAGLMRFIAGARELDLQVFLTEMDVNDRALARDIAARDIAVAAAYKEYLDMVLGDPAVTAIVMWGVTDKYTWLNHEDARADGMPERPLLFDSGHNPKRAFFAVREAFNSRSTRRM